MGCSPSHQDRRQSESQMDGQSLWSLSWRLRETGQTQQLILRGNFIGMKTISSQEFIQRPRLNKSEAERAGGTQEVRVEGTVSTGEKGICADLATNSWKPPFR